MLTEEEIRASLAALNQALAARDLRGEICLFGGAVMVLAFRARQSTKDVDAIFGPAAAIRELAAGVGQERGLEEDWLNDGVKGFVSAHPATTSLELGLSNLSVLMPVPEYLLAMKCMAARSGESARDLEDVKFLLEHLGLDDKEQVLPIIEAYYPAPQLTVKTAYFVEVALEELAAARQRVQNYLPSHEENPPEEDARHTL